MKKATIILNVILLALGAFMAIKQHAHLSGSQMAFLFVYGCFLPVFNTIFIVRKRANQTAS